MLLLQTEAEYVEHSRRPLVPVCIQPHFTPDGWLTALLADKFVYNFSHESYIGLMLDNLLKDISCCSGARAKKTRHKENISSKDVLPQSFPYLRSAHGVFILHVLWSCASSSVLFRVFRITSPFCLVSILGK